MRRSKANVFACKLAAPDPLEPLDPNQPPPNRRRWLLAVGLIS